MQATGIDVLFLTDGIAYRYCFAFVAKLKCLEKGADKPVIEASVPDAYFPNEKGKRVSTMKGSLDDQLKTKIKRLIVDNCDLDIQISEIDDAAPLFERTSSLELDSIDALQISIAIQNTFGIAIRDSKEMRRVMKSVNSFADYIQPE